jgi:hypothetical protein
VKSLSLIPVVSALLMVTAHADLTIVQDVEGAGPVSHMTLKVKGDKSRVEASPQVTTIIDGRTGDMLNLMNEQKKFMRISGAQTKALMQSAAQSAGQAQQKPKLTPTGKKETINGYEAQEYVSETPQFKASYWVATNYPDAAAITKQLQAVAPQAWGLSTGSAADYSDFPGLPLRTRISIGGKEIVTNITSVKQEPLADALFSPPPDFQEMKMPDLGRILGGKGAAQSPKPGVSPKP